MTNVLPSVSNKKLAIALSMAVAVVGVSGLLFWRGGKANDISKPAPNPVATASALQVEPLVKANYVHYVRLADAGQTAISSADIARLNSVGSLKGGLTTQFKQATHAKMTYRFGRKQPLAFMPVRSQLMASSGFVLTGREYEGEIHNGKYHELYRLFENPTTKGRIELFETLINQDRPVVMIQETLNDQIAGVPVCLEQMTDKKGRVYYSVSFVARDRYYRVNSKLVPKDQLMAILTEVVQANQ